MVQGIAGKNIEKENSEAMGDGRGKEERREKLTEVATRLYICQLIKDLKSIVTSWSTLGNSGYHSSYFRLKKKEKPKKKHTQFSFIP